MPRVGKTGRTPARPLLVGELNPYGGDDEFALYPAPDGCSGHRLCCLILGMSRRDYLDTFDRCNLCQVRWSLKAAREKSFPLRSPGSRLILCGAKVAEAFRVPYDPFFRWDVEGGPKILVLPHPSGLCRTWNKCGAVEHARRVVVELVPELKELVPCRR